MSNNNIVSKNNSQDKNKVKFSSQATYEGGTQVELTDEAVNKANRVFSSDKKNNSVLSQNRGLNENQTGNEKRGGLQNEEITLRKSKTDTIYIDNNNGVNDLSDFKNSTETPLQEFTLRKGETDSVKSKEKKSENDEINSSKKPNPIYLIAFFILLLGSLGFAYFKFFKQQETEVKPAQTLEVEEKNIVLEYWGLWETEEVMEPILKEFEENNANISVMYKNNDQKNYFSKLNDALDLNQGPDVFRFHNSWVGVLKENLDAVPSYVYSNSSYKETFFPVNFEQLNIENSIYGVPLSHEGLALVYNKQLFKDMGQDYPNIDMTWVEFKNLAKNMTKKSGGEIVQAGAAFGLSSNVDNFSDILGTLLYQVGADLETVDEKYYPEVFDFYTSFYNDSRNRVWDESFETSTIAFSEEKVAMILAPSWRIHEIIYRNPNLEFGLVPVPVFAKNEKNVEADAKTDAIWASVWSDGVNVNTDPEKKEAAWKLLKFLSSKEIQLSFSNMIKEGGYRSFGPIFSRQDLAQTNDDEINFAYLNNAMQSKSWYLNSETHDGELNDQMIAYFASAVNTLTQSDKETKTVYQTLQNGINSVLEKYELGEAKK